MIKNVLLICANPRGTDALRLGEEERTLKEALRLSKHRDSLRVTVLSAATIDDVRRGLREKSYDVVHFSGHGTLAGLALEDEVGRLLVPNSAAVGKLLQMRGVSTVLLNACYSLQAFAGIPVDYAVAMEGPIADVAAIEFTRGFYDALASGLDIPSCYEEGILCCELKGLKSRAVLLRDGEAPKPAGVIQLEEDTPGRSATLEKARRLLLGVALDTSGSMRSRIQNHQRGALSRLSSAKSGLVRLARHIGREVKAPATDQAEVDSSRVFVYAFGLRGRLLADLLSLIKAAEQVDIHQIVENRKREIEDEARRRYGGAAHLASMAKDFGLGGLVDQMERSARAGVESAAREEIAQEVFTMLLGEAERLGDTIVGVSELVRLLDNRGGRDFIDELEALIYGDTPMKALACEVLERFERTPPLENEDRVFLLLSDGEPTDDDPLPILVQLRERGVTVITCYVTDVDVANPKLLLAAPEPHWPEGARLMFDAASEIEESGPFANYLLRKGWAIEPRARLFVQVNHSDVLDEFVQIVGSTVRSNQHLLPEGR